MFMKLISELPTIAQHAGIRKGNYKRWDKETGENRGTTVATKLRDKRKAFHAIVSQLWGRIERSFQKP